MTPTEPGLTRAPIAEDILVLEHAARDEEIRAMATNRDAVERLWEVCQVPDYRKIAPATHAELAVTLYGFLMREGKIPADWFSAQIAQADRTDGDIDTLSNRIAHVRTWTFVANRPDWLADPEHWQAVARSVEDKLSDAMHERLTERFVDRRTSVLMRRLRENTTLETEIKKTGEVVVEGHDIGRLDGFTFVADASAAGSEAKTLQGAARSALAGEIDARATKVTQAPDREFVLSSDGSVRWTGAPVGKLIAGDDVLRPQASRHRRRATHRRVARGGADAARSLARESHRTVARAVVRAGRSRRHHRHRARRCLPVDRVDRRAGAPEGGRGRQRPRPAVARTAAQIRRALRRLSSLPAGAAQARAAQPRGATVDAQARQSGGQGPRRVAAACFERPHLDPDRQGHAEAALPHHRLSRVRRARHPRRHPGAARRSDPAGAGLARGIVRAQSRPARSTASASPSRRR